MRKIIIIILILCCTMISVYALEIEAPSAPRSAEEYMPVEPKTFGEGLLWILKQAAQKIQPSLVQALTLCSGVIGIVLLVSLIQLIPGANDITIRLAGVFAISALLLEPSQSLIHLGVNTVREISEYGKLLLPVMTAALAAQGGATSSAALFAGTALFNSILSSAISSLIVPLIYIYLCLCAADVVSVDTSLEKLSKFVKGIMVWLLKTVLYVFTGYMGITGVVSGATDAAALKATKLTISGMVPVVGGILSEASEAILVSAGLIKNAAGVYGLLAVIAVWIGPFIQIGIQYLLMKLTGSICQVFGNKQTVKLINDFTSAMGILVGMTGAACLLQLISTVCFMKGMG